MRSENRVAEKKGLRKIQRVRAIKMLSKNRTVGKKKRSKLQYSDHCQKKMA